MKSLHKGILANRIRRACDLPVKRALSESLTKAELVRVLERLPTKRERRRTRKLRV